MPRRSFWQPYDPDLPDPFRWEFQFSQPNVMGMPGAPFPLDYQWMSSWVACDERYLEGECRERLEWFDEDTLRFVYPTALEVSDCINVNAGRCRLVDIQTPPDGWLMIRACGEPTISCSQWTAVSAPEPGVSLGLLMGVLLVCAWGRRRPGRVSRVRQPRQRGALRRRIREVLRLDV